MNRDNQGRRSSSDESNTESIASSTGDESQLSTPSPSPDLGSHVLDSSSDPSPRNSYNGGKTTQPHHQINGNARASLTMGSSSSSQSSSQTFQLDQDSKNYLLSRVTEGDVERISAFVLQKSVEYSTTAGAVSHAQSTANSAAVAANATMSSPRSTPGASANNNSKQQTSSKASSAPAPVVTVQPPMPPMSTEEVISAIINARLDKEENTMLHKAATYNKEELARWLIEHGANPMQTNALQATALHCAAAAGADQTIMTLLSFMTQSSLEERDYYGNTPIHLAVKNSRATTVENLLKCGASVRTKLRGGKSFTPLHLACILGYSKIVHLFLENGASVKSIDEDGMVPFLRSLGLETLPIQIDGGDITVPTCLHQRTELQGLIETWNLIIHKDPTHWHKFTSNDRQNCLHVCAEYGNAEFLKLVHELSGSLLAGERFTSSGGAEGSPTLADEQLMFRHLFLARDARDTTPLQLAISIFNQLNETVTFDKVVKWESKLQVKTESLLKTPIENQVDVIEALLNLLPQPSTSPLTMSAPATPVAGYAGVASQASTPTPDQASPTNAASAPVTPQGGAMAPVLIIDNRDIINMTVVNKDGKKESMMHLLLGSLAKMQEMHMEMVAELLADPLMAHSAELSLYVNAIKLQYQFYQRISDLMVKKGCNLQYQSDSGSTIADLTIQVVNSARRLAKATNSSNAPVMSIAKRSSYIPSANPDHVDARNRFIHVAQVLAKRILHGIIVPPSPDLSSQSSQPSSASSSPADQPSSRPSTDSVSTPTADKKSGKKDKDTKFKSVFANLFKKQKDTSDTRRRSVDMAGQGEFALQFNENSSDQ